MQKYINKSYLLILLSVLSAIAPISIATYLPAMPSMAEYYNLPISYIELSLSIFMFGFSLGQLFGGPISDRKGRKFCSLLGLFGFSFFSFLIIFSTTVYELWIYRFLEAFFAGFIVINATAIIRDLYSGKEAANYFSLLGSIRSIVPMVAPMIGALILFFAPWKGIFAFLTIYSLFLAFLIIKDLEETYTYTKRKIIESYISVLTHKKAMMMMFVLALGFSSMFSIITKLSFIYMEHFHVGVNLFSVYYGLNFVLLMTLATLNTKFIKYFSQLNILKTAVSVQILFAAIFTFFYEDLTLYSTIIILGIYIAMNGLIYGNATSMVLENFSKNAGVASALIGVIQFGMASIISSIIVSFHGQTLLPIGIGMLMISLTSILILRKY
ncbi:drug resistance transporter, Bcr/CflA family [Arcobacter venerupis]|uniref:Drug resistance transporter, Bcr/CflA family n=1 Tax=Arcobacter venerupis TaxID=1054033 RepID=A0AAE7BC32_9BACT|nr:multidrug effflux MFS transporter [Arcobacter venerupis]QKF67667.1 drug resistance transporter, Bcr/CflA family [Arcobacter venerupis]RWS49175.1 Bcr/CflA family drug resistance efflux transporter [Arcobacter venerupis]